MKILLWLLFWPFLLPFYIGKKMFKIILKAGNVDIKNITSSMNTANDKYQHNFKKLSSSINTANDKIHQKELEDYGKRMGIEPVDLNEDLYDY
jgi:hypothetical protein